VYWCALGPPARTFRRGLGIATLQPPPDPSHKHFSERFSKIHVYHKQKRPCLCGIPQSSFLCGKCNAPHPPRGCPSNSLGPVWANMYSNPLLTTTPAVVGIDNPDCVKWRETLPSQEESAGRDIPMGELVTKVLVSRESPLPPRHLWPGHNSPVSRR